MVKVSVCVPIYGVEKYIEQCAVSLFEQTYDNIEYIFVNDCTPDKSIEVLKSVIEKYPERKGQVKIINHERNLGLAGARNTAVEKATGEYIAHVDSDDWIDTNYIQELVDVAVKNEADIVRCDVTKEYPDHSVVRHFKYYADKERMLQLMVGELDIVSHAIWGAIYKTRLYKDNDIKAKVGVNHGEDYSVTPALTLCANKIHHVSKPYYHYRLGNENSYMNNIKIDSLLQLKEANLYLSDFFRRHNALTKYADSIGRGRLSIPLVAMENNLNAQSLISDGYLNIEGQSTIFRMLSRMSELSVDIRNRFLLRACCKIYKQLLIYKFA